jgi:SAM-dependent methyltransferase
MQILPVNPAAFKANRFSDLVWQARAREGLAVERLYLVPYAGAAADQLALQVNTDLAAGIRSRVISVASIPQSADLGPLDTLFTFDGNSVLIGQRAPRGGLVDDWRLSTRPEDLERASRLWGALTNIATGDREGGDESALSLQEPLATSADLIAGVAPVLCTGDHIDEEGCVWYHGAWQYLRLLDMVSTPTWHSDFYSAGLDAAIDAGCTSFLVTGAADYSMFAYIDDALRRHGSEGRITVLDKCPTPLFSCRWYAKRMSRPVSPIEADVFKWGEAAAPGSFDVICTDAFLTRFTPELAQSVVAIWRRILRPGGLLLTTVRSYEPLTTSDREAAIDRFQQRSITRAQRWQSYLSRSPAEIGTLAGNYARKMKSWSLGDDAAVEELMRSSGFQLLDCRRKDVPGELEPTVYLELMCRVEG